MSPRESDGAGLADDYAEHVRRVVDQAPPLTPEQRDRIAALLRPAPDVGGGRAA